MFTTFTSTTTKQAILALCFGLLLFAGSAFQAHAASDADQASLMASQLNAASQYLKLISASQPKPQVLGASISLTQDEIQAQIDGVTNQINQLTGQQAPTGSNGKGGEGRFRMALGFRGMASSTRTGTSTRLECRVAKSSTGSSTTATGVKGGKGGDCRNGELVRLLAAQKEIDARIAELQAKSAEIKARIANIMSRTTFNPTASKLNARFVPPFGKNEKKHTDTTASSTDATIPAPVSGGV